MSSEASRRASDRRRVVLASLVSLIVVLSLVAFWLASDESTAPADAAASLGTAVPRDLSVPSLAASSDARREVPNNALALAPAIEPPPSAFCVVQCVDVRGAPVSGAVLTVTAADADIGGERLAIADADGRARLDAARLAGREVCARAPRHARACSFAPDPPPAELRIVLGDEGSLVGRVVYRDRSPVGAGCVVLAYSLERVPSTRDVRAALELEHGPGFTTETDAEGRFELRELPRGRVWTLCAGRLGCASTELVGCVAPSTDPVELVVDRIHGVVLELVDEQHEPAVLSNVDPSGGRGRFWSEDPAAIGPLFEGELAAYLGGVDDALAETRRHEQLVLFTARERVERLGPNLYEATLPGYAPFRARFDAPALERGLARQLVVLTSTAAGRGVVRVVMRSTDPLRGFPSGRLELVDAQGAVTSYWFEPSADGSRTIDGVPYGRYEATFFSGVGTWRHPDAGDPPVAIDVRDAPVELAVSLDPSGNLEIDPGWPDAGSLRALLSCPASDDAAEGSVSEGIVLHGPPYVLRGLRAGDYTWMEILGRPDRSVEPLHVRVEAGKVARLRLERDAPR